MSGKILEKTLFGGKLRNWENWKNWTQKILLIKMIIIPSVYLNYDSSKQQY